MSNADIVRDLYRAFGARDRDRLRAILAEDVEWRQSPGFPNAAVRHGVDAVLTGIVGAFEPDWEGWRFHPDSFLCDGETVIVIGVYRGVNRATGRRVESETAHVYELRAGRIVRFRQYADTKVIHDAMP